MFDGESPAEIRYLPGGQESAFRPNEAGCNKLPFRLVGGADPLVKAPEGLLSALPCLPASP